MATLLRSSHYYVILRSSHYNPAPFLDVTTLHFAKKTLGPPPGAAEDDERKGAAEDDE